MNGVWRRIVNLLMVLVLAVGAMSIGSGCREEGPAEEAGEAVNQAAENVGDAAENAVN